MVKYYPNDKSDEERFQAKKNRFDMDDELVKRFISSKYSFNQELPVKYTEQEMDEMRIPLPYRNACAHLHVAFTNCVTDKKAHLLPWRCELENARLKRCLYKLWLRDVRRSEDLHRAEYKLRLIYEELEKKGVELPMARRFQLRGSEIETGQFDGASAEL